MKPGQSVSRIPAVVMSYTRAGHAHFRKGTKASGNPVPFDSDDP